MVSFKLQFFPSPISAKDSLPFTQLQGRYTIIIVHRSLDAIVKNRCAAPVCHLIAAPPPW
jgi:hypothetical protein